MVARLARLVFSAHEDPASQAGDLEAEVVESSVQQLGLLVAVTAVLRHGGQQTGEGEVRHLTSTVKINILVGKPGEVLPVHREEAPLVSRQLQLLRVIQEVEIFCKLVSIHLPLLGQLLSVCLELSEMKVKGEDENRFCSRAGGGTVTLTVRLPPVKIGVT